MRTLISGTCTSNFKAFQKAFCSRITFWTAHIDTTFSWWLVPSGVDMEMGSPNRALKQIVSPLNEELGSLLCWKITANRPPLNDVKRWMTWPKHSDETPPKWFLTNELESYELKKKIVKYFRYLMANDQQPRQLTGVQTDRPQATGYEIKQIKHPHRHNFAKILKMR
jgi:hypothetical protein